MSITSSTDCHQYHKEVTKNDNAAAIAIGAAALIGAAPLAHQSHHGDDKHGEESRSVAELYRGYRDGLHHERYHNYNEPTAYSDGYSAGRSESDDEAARVPDVWVIARAAWSRDRSLQHAISVHTMEAL